MSLHYNVNVKVIVMQLLQSTYLEDAG